MTIQQLRQKAESIFSKQEDTTEELQQAFEYYEMGLWTRQECIDFIMTSLENNEELVEDEIHFEELEIDAKAILEERKKASGVYQDIILAYHKDKFGYYESYQQILEKLIEKQGGVWADYENYLNKRIAFI